MLNDIQKFKIEQLKRDKAAYIKTATEVEECIKKYVESMDWCCKDLEISNYPQNMSGNTIVVVSRGCVDKNCASILRDEFYTTAYNGIGCECESDYSQMYIGGAIQALAIYTNGDLHLNLSKKHKDIDATILKIAKETSLHGTIIRSTSEYVTNLLNKNRFPHIADGRPNCTCTNTHYD